MAIPCEEMIKKYSLEPYFIEVAWQTANIKYLEPYFGEENTMFTGYTYGKPSFGKKNYLQFLKEMDIETTIAAYECFSENINKNAIKLPNLVWMLL